MEELQVVMSVVLLWQWSVGNEGEYTLWMVTHTRTWLINFRLYSKTHSECVLSNVGVDPALKLCRTLECKAFK